MKRLLKGHNAIHKDCELEITDAGAQNLVWLNVVYKNKREQRPYIVVNEKELIHAINDIKQAGLC